MKLVSDFISAVKARQAEIAAGLAHGNAPDYNAYQRLVGENLGLEASLDIFNHLLKEDEDD
jgi:hypothetical protein|tara:strand:- start:492 stop:674 length:183 start_codon:yes stop_codon:yes gene_type:complete